VQRNTLFFEYPESLHWGDTIGLSIGREGFFFNVAIDEFENDQKTINMLLNEKLGSFSYLTAEPIIHFVGFHNNVAVNETMLAILEQMVSTLRLRDVTTSCESIIGNK